MESVNQEARGSVEYVGSIDKRCRVSLSRYTLFLRYRFKKRESLSCVIIFHFFESLLRLKDYWSRTYVYYFLYSQVDVTLLFVTRHYHLYCVIGRFIIFRDIFSFSISHTINI